jgi:glycerophosphoryl diester phosphodiesterase
VGRPWRRGALIGAASAAFASLAVGSTIPASASPYIHAHRGGSLVTAGAEQRPRFPENTMPAFRDAAARGFVLELDAKLTADRVPVVIHDATLDRTTSCAGRVDALTFAELRERCAVDVLGTEGNLRQLGPRDRRRAKVPSLARVLTVAKRRGSTVNLEIKNQPTDPDFDAGPGFARTVANVVRASGLPPSRLIVQSFWPSNLDVFEDDPYFDGAASSLLTLAALNDAGPALAALRGYEWVSPAWPVSSGYIAKAHRLGLQVVPYTIDGGAEIEAATRSGVDAVITNDPRLARSRVRAASPPAPAIPPPPSKAECRESAATRTAPPILARDAAPRAPRVFAMQPKQELRHVTSYASFRTKIECLIRRYVKPRLARDRPNVVAFNEDIGLMTLATGSRGAGARGLFADPETAPGCEPQGVPCGVLSALALVDAGYATELAAYRVRFPSMPVLSSGFVAATDTFARGWMQVFSDMARRYDVYILGSNNQAPFRESVDPAEIDEFRDPDLPRPDSVYVATSGLAYNEVFMWGPENVRKEGPPMLRNVVAWNRKVPVTPIEETIEIAPGPASGPDAIENLRPYRLPGTRARISFATSLPAFVYGYRLGEELPPLDPCSDVTKYYMACMDRLGANVVMQDEANPGRWAGQSGEGNFQPLEWMRSTWRAVADPTVGFDYNVTPHLVGNLADLAFDGQTAITQRGRARGRGCTYVGNREFLDRTDPEYLRRYAGRKRQFLALAPWVTPDAPRDALRATAAALAPGSGSPLENDYVETAVIADLPFPVDRGRRACARARPR